MKELQSSVAALKSDFAKMLDQLMQVTKENKEMRDKLDAVSTKSAETLGMVKGLQRATPLKRADRQQEQRYASAANLLPPTPNSHLSGLFTPPPSLLQDNSSNAELKDSMKSMVGMMSQLIQLQQASMAAPSSLGPASYKALGSGGSGMFGNASTPEPRRDFLHRPQSRGSRGGSAYHDGSPRHMDSQERHYGAHEGQHRGEDQGLQRS